MEIYNPNDIASYDLYKLDENWITGEESNKHIVFLAGPCPRKPEDGDWREDFYKILKDHTNNESLIILTPTNLQNNDSMKDFNWNEQVNWERTAMLTAHTILFWVARDKNNPGLTTNVEFGYWLAKTPEKIVYGRPDNAEHTGYLDWLFKNEIYEIGDEVKINTKIYNSLNDLADLICEKEDV